jgi:hypothetical protein
MSRTSPPLPPPREGVLAETVVSRVNSGDLPRCSVQASTSALAVLAYAATGDLELSNAVLESGLTAAALCQPRPLVSREGDALLVSAKARLCAAIGITPLAYRPSEAAKKRALGGDADAPPRARACRRLFPAAYLTTARLRVALDNAVPHYHRLEDGSVRCECCRRGVAVENDDELRALIYSPVWSELRWKTFVCAECRATTVSAAHEGAAAVCRNCFSQPPTSFVPLIIATADDVNEPRRLPLCERCHRECAVQLETVEYHGGGGDE